MQNLSTDNHPSNLLFMVTCENKEVCNKVLKVMEEEKKQKTIISDFKLFKPTTLSSNIPDMIFSLSTISGPIGTFIF